MPSGRMLIFGAMVDDEMRALGKLQREQEPTSPFVFTSVRGSPFTAAGFAPMVERAGVEAQARLSGPSSHAAPRLWLCIGQQGPRYPGVQAYLGHCNIQHPVRYTELSPGRFKDFWR